MLTAAWLPRGLRLRLRQPPYAQLRPSLPGVWSTPRSSVPGAVASRVVDGETYDLFVGFQTVYPAQSRDRSTIPPARLSLAEPAAGPPPAMIAARAWRAAAPISWCGRCRTAGRPAGFDGPVARDLSVEYRLAQSSARAGVGDARWTSSCSGAGNLPLWPSPKVVWPPEARVYEEGTEATRRARWASGSAATKRFRLAVVPDSAGSLSLPPIEYPYFDPGGAAYQVARAPGIIVPVLDAAPVGRAHHGDPHRNRTRPVAGGAALPARPAADRGPGGPAVAGDAGHRAGSADAAAEAPPYPGAVQPILPKRLERLVSTLAGHTGSATPRALVSALRAAGVEREEAERLVALHASARGRTVRRRPAPAEPQPELSRVDRGCCWSESLGSVRRLAGAIPLLCFMLGGAVLQPVRLQAQSGVELYMRGEYAAAALAFRNESSGMPRAVRLYDLAAAEYMASRDAHAVAALLMARERAPRNRHVETLWNTLAREHEQLRRAGIPLAPHRRRAARRGARPPLDCRAAVHHRGPPPPALGGRGAAACGRRRR